ncbi:MAG TPA: RcnB family protein [Rhizomicrobium sp.]|nr:RcnB family protein [Rhizomicrobium sp.]
MKRLLIATTALTLLVAPLGQAFAKDWDDHHDNGRHGGRDSMMMDRDHDRFDRHDNGRHRGWYKGGHIERSDWDRGYRVHDWRRYHLAEPPRGYEWRRVDNNYVLAAAATGLIMGMALANQ